MRRAAAVAMILVAGVSVALIASGSEPSGGKIHASFLGAPNLIDGAPVRIAGIKAGEVDGIEVREGLADVGLRIEERFWPLTEGTRATIRWGGTIALANRYVELSPGDRDAQPLRDGARLPTPDTLTPVEFSELFNLFDRPTRANLGRFIDRTAANLGPSGPSLSAGLRSAAPAARQSARLLDDLGANPRALRVLLDSGARTAQALTSNQRRLHDLVDAYASTADTIARHADAVGETFERSAPTLRDLRATLTGLDPTLDEARSLVVALRPGARATRALAPAASATVHRVRAVAPRLTRTLKTAERRGPQITSFLGRAGPELRRLRRVIERATPQVGCVRLYTPEIAAFATLWGSALRYKLPSGVYGRVNLTQYLFGNNSTKTSAELTQEDPNLGYARIQPPGFPQGTPHYAPECGITPAGIDPTQDWWTEP